MVKEGQFPFARYPVVPGHEIAGVIEAIGERVQFLACGTRVGLSALFSSCGVCSQCLGADEFLCEKLEFTGITKDGGFQEYLLAPSAYAAPIPESFGLVEAAPLMCAGLTVFSGMRHAGFEHGNKVAVIGLGGLVTWLCFSRNPWEDELRLFRRAQTRKLKPKHLAQNNSFTPRQRTRQMR